MLAQSLFGLVVVLAANPCTNGSFEERNGDGYPVDWEILNDGRVLYGDAFEGEYALHVVRDAGDPHPETGLNRRWRAHSGEQGAMLDQVRGGMKFHYKVTQQTNENIRFCVIPMDATAFECTGPRAVYAVPQEHVGDGQWHRGRLKYDYSGNDEVKWVHFGLRITGGAGEILVDSIRYVEQVGVLLRVEGLRLEESEDTPGEAATLFASLVNAGDMPAEDVRVRVACGAELRAEPRKSTVPLLAPDARLPLRWDIAGERKAPGRLVVHVEVGDEQGSGSVLYRPELLVEHCGPVTPIVLGGQPVKLRCVLRNPGQATVLWPRVRFGGKEQSCPRLLPGERVVLESEGKAVPPGKAGFVDLVALADNVGGEVVERVALPVQFDVELPPPSAKLRAYAGQDFGILENGNLRLALLHQGGVLAGQLDVPGGGAWHTVAQIPRLFRVRHRVGDKVLDWRRPLAFEAFEEEGAAGIRVGQEGSALSFGFSASFRLAKDSHCIEAEHRLEAHSAQEVLRFDGPMVYALERDEALFPGAEWLIEDEVSSSTLDIEEGHPQQVRYVPHPNMITIPAIGVHGPQGTVGLLWDARQRWDGERDRPCAVFASPDRFNRRSAHLMGLQLPTVPEFMAPNERDAATPYALGAGGALRLAYTLYADAEAPDALAAMDEWFRRYGYPEAAPLPRGSYEAELAFSMRAYLESLWEPETREWWTSKGGHPLMAHKARPPAYIADLLAGAVRVSEPEIREACRERAEEMAALIGRPARIDMMRFGERCDCGAGDNQGVLGALASRAEDGLWHFDAGRQDEGVFKGIDYHEIGPDGAVALGTCAGPARQVMRYVMKTGDWGAYEALLPALDYMAAVRVPRAAQVWEVPFHSPDVLAAAYAVDAFLDAYRFADEPRWLEAAVGWARKGLPFIYCWQDPERPYLLGASIPVFGATFYRHSWFAQPVQWNGLVLADALVGLDAYDDSRPWRRIAETIVHSALYQQAEDGENVALWPDAISAIDGTKSPWVFAPRQILGSINKLRGWDERPRSTLLGEGKHRIHLTSAGRIENAVWEGAVLSFGVDYPKGEQGSVLVANVSRPESVAMDGHAVPEDPRLTARSEAGWRYDDSQALLTIRVPKNGVFMVHGLALRYVDRLPGLRETIAFDFEEGREGFVSLNNISGMDAKDGSLAGGIVGGDPYLARTALSVAGEDCPVLEVRMRLSDGVQGQLYWSTRDAPGFAEERVLHFTLHSDGAFHTYRLDMVAQPAWHGQTITGIRLDPGNGAEQGEFAIDYVRCGGQ